MAGMQDEQGQRRTFGFAVCLFQVRLFPLQPPLPTGLLMSKSLRDLFIAPPRPEMPPAAPAPDTTSHLKRARRVIQTGWLLFMVSLVVPVLGTEPGALAFVYSLMMPFFLLEKPSWLGLAMSFYSVVNLGLIFSLFISFSEKLLARPASSVFFVLVALDTMWIPFTPEQEFAQRPAFWFWSASAVVVAIGMNMARLKEKAHQAAQAQHQRARDAT